MTRDVMVCDRHGCQAEKLTDRVIAAEKRVEASRAVLDRWNDLSDTTRRNLLEVALKGASS